MTSDKSTDPLAEKGMASSVDEVSFFMSAIAGSAFYVVDRNNFYLLKAVLRS